MIERYYKDGRQILIKRCRVPGCPASFRPERGSSRANLGLCWPHRRIYFRHRYINWFLPWFAKQTPEVQQRYRKMKYTRWLKWVRKNMETLTRRRGIELRSYHKQKAQRQEKRNAHRREYYARTGR